MREQIQLDQPYDFKQALARLAIDPLLVIVRDTEHIKVPLWINDSPVTVDLSQTGTFSRPVFNIEANLPAGVTDEDVITELSNRFHWDVTISEIADHFRGNDLYPLVEKYRGTPFVCDFQRTGALMKAIIHQQLNMTFAFTLTTRFVKTYGFEHDGAWFYPEAKTVKNIDPGALRELQFSRRKAEYVIGLAEEFDAGRLSLEQFEQSDDAEIQKLLTSIRGIGPWTAENFLMFGLGRLDLFPVQDIGLQNGMKHFFGWDDKPSKETMLDYSKDWSPYRTYAALYLWESIETG
ncbi:DNA-3-methyladenine glycosylase family protein [Salisediminibacterium halotolerans]|uniref:DNA-3-methyladenine glycosylase II n=1 Tax=Salisediminibacterium halotolerans TaxID=517425 RepID=A0A1H9UFP2_9BACI|nr:DNA-3-methyladenine glycosylase [Salisediminibacterium haloalkalitolerans]SES08088.1 DNA-3-methyladenine glycosylase II [Salisediminibacterium haloalkalitolerans]